MKHTITTQKIITTKEMVEIDLPEEDLYLSIDHLKSFAHLKPIVVNIEGEPTLIKYDVQIIESHWIDFVRSGEINLFTISDDKRKTPEDYIRSHLFYINKGGLVREITKAEYGTKFCKVIRKLALFEDFGLEFIH